MTIFSEMEKSLRTSRTPEEERNIKKYVAKMMGKLEYAAGVGVGWVSWLQTKPEEQCQSWTGADVEMKMMISGFFRIIVIPWAPNSVSC